MIVVNFAHPLTEAQRRQIEEWNGPIARVIDVPTQFDHEADFGPQVERLAAGIALTAAEWQTERLLINPPSFGPIVAVLLAHVHGRCGYFPDIVRMRPVAGSSPPAFEVAEIVALQAIRDDGRRRR